MSRAVVAAILVWLAIVAIWEVFLHGGTVYMCLGGVNVTEASCRAANGMPPLTDVDRFMRSWAPDVILVVGGTATIVGIARWRRQRGGL